jgi:cell division protein FtsW
METATAQKHPIDKVLLLVVLSLMLIGMVMIYSASNVIAYEKFGSSTHFLKQQFIRMVLGFAILVGAARFDYHRYHGKTMLLVLISFVLLVTVLGLSKIKGTARWIGVGGFGIQPSEIAKTALIFYMASYLNGKGERIRDFQNGVLPPLIITSVFCLMIVLQPNFSTAAVLMGIVLVMMFVGGMQMKHFLGLAVSVVPLGVLAVVTSPYRMARLMTFLDPTADAQGGGYQIKQSLISFANGGLTGVGVGQGKQKLLFLPEPFTDFIYSIIGEELGFIGAMVVLALFLIFLFRTVRIARTAPDLYGFYLAVGIIVSIVAYALINAGVAVGVLPTTGLPMPFISYGGTSLLFTCFMIGVLLNISSQTVPKSEALKRPAGEERDDLFTANFNVGLAADMSKAVGAEEQPVQKKRERPSIVGLDFSDA